jgi:hypothetical protein
MLKSQKFQLTCSYCSRIFKDPIVLPCNDTICRQHLSEKEVKQANKIECTKCKKEFVVKGNEFKSNEDIVKLIESKSHLNDEELILKQELEASIRRFFEIYDQFMQNKTQLESDVYDHFQELRFQIDQHREELKKKIDDIALQMIDKVTENEDSFSKNLKANYSSFDNSKSLKNELNEIEETFRNPNLLIQTIKEMQQRQEESLNNIQLKLNEMSLVKEFLEKKNEFQPNSSLLYQNETSSLFGSIRLNAMSLESFRNSQILISEQTFLQVIELCEFSPNDKWSLLYRGTRDGFGSSDFHLKCDGHSNTLTILKAKGSEFIFGGYTTIDWESSVQWKSDPNAFIFSLTNKDNTPLKMKINPNKHEYAIECHSSFGPTFGCFEIRIANNSNTTMGSFSNLGDSYSHPQYERGTNEAETFLAGTEWFQLDEIEVYKKE